MAVNGRPRSNNPSSRALPHSQRDDNFQGATELAKSGRPRKSSDKTLARRSSKGSLVSALIADPRLSDEDRRVIQHAVKNPFTLDDLSALIAYEIRMARVFLENGTLAPKDYVIAMNKAAQHMTSVTQLAQGDGTARPTSIAVQVNLGESPEGRRANVVPSDPVVGDIVDVE